MNSERVNASGSRPSPAARFIRGKGKPTGGRKRNYLFTSNYWKKRSRLTNPRASEHPAEGASNSPATLANPPFPAAPELFAAPVSPDEQQVPVIAIVNPPQYPGWRLYFPTEIFSESSPMLEKVRAFEKHILTHPGVYYLKQIRERRWFHFSSDVLLRDADFVLSWSEFTQQIQETPRQVLSCVGLAMHNVVTKRATEEMVAFHLDTGPELDQYRSRKVRVSKINARPVGFITVLSVASIAPKSYDRLFAVQGRIDSVTQVETKCTWVAFKCKRCGHEQAIRQADYYPTKPKSCRVQCNSKRNFVEMRSSPYTRIECLQLLQLHETALHSRMGAPPTLDLELREDLVNGASPGAEVIVVGILKRESTRNTFMQVVTMLHMDSKLANTPGLRPTRTAKDLEIVETIAREPNCLRLLVQSLAPEVCGYEVVKAGVLLSLFGGAGTQMSDDGELNILVVGDPGVGKTNILQNAASISETGELISTKSQSSSLTLCQQTRPSNGLNVHSRLDSGLLLRSHDGYCCIDDMDKLSSNQESLIHIMQTKTESSRSTATTVNVAAKVSVIAAVNPTGVHYDNAKLLAENVHLSCSLLSLFHFSFILFDKADKDRDSQIADHVKDLHSGLKKVLAMVPSRLPLEQTPKQDDDEADLGERLKLSCNEKLDLLPTVLLKKYVSYARKNIKPMLTHEAASELKQFYMSLRSERNDEGRFAITTHQLQGLISLAQARARVDLCTEVKKTHMRDVIDLVRHSFAEVSTIHRLNSTFNDNLASTSHGNQVRKFIQMLQVKSNALGKKVFEYEEIKDMATHVGIKCGVANMVELVNAQGILLKKGPNLYEVISQ